ncbi:MULTISPECIES: urease subunit beta [Bacillaceae]|uniref:urease subunit beta n=1 Tax=Bacillaceae TaxID=186817 RepID=UPI000BFC6BCB|nr:MULTISPECIES: urease subunit beta [Bacillaceae]PGT87686.1 urease subunit beta [Bacillus sp. AFS040349]UGB29392.1 urease subunit beta [Metabacillus sp. B2-18]
MVPGQLRLKNEPIICNVNKQPTQLEVVNNGDRPVQIGSHFHFYEVNRSLEFDREKAFGRRLNIPAGTAVRFEPGDQKVIELIPFSGERRIYGLNNLTNDALDKGV